MKSASPPATARWTAGMCWAGSAALRLGGCFRRQRAIDIAGVEAAGDDGGINIAAGADVAHAGVRLVFHAELEVPAAVALGFVFAVERDGLQRCRFAADDHLAAGIA